MKYLTAILLCIFLFLLPVAGANGEIIVNEYVSVTTITRNELIHIFLFYKKFWSNNGAKIVVILPPIDSVLFRKLASEELHLSPTSYLENLKLKIRAGQAQPVFVESELEVLIKVSNTPNSIGFYYGGLKYNDGYGIKSLAIN